MNCPRCNGELVATQKIGLEVDVCGGCRGIWLDRGELEKIAARATSTHHEDDDRRNYRNRHDEDDDGPPGRRRESFWGRLLDFD